MPNAQLPADYCGDDPTRLADAICRIINVQNGGDDLLSLPKMACYRGEWDLIVIALRIAARRLTATPSDRALGPDDNTTLPRGRPAP